MRKVLLGSLVLGLLGALACVGDDPAPAGGGNGDGGAAEGGTPPTTPPGTPPGTPPPPSSGGDAATDAGPCDLTKDFTTVEALTTVNTADNELAAALTQDELQIVLASSHGSANPTAIDSQDLWVATRTSRTTQSFGAPSKVLTVGINSPKLDIDPTLTVDGNTVYWSQRDQDGSAQHFLRYATRTSPSDSFTGSSNVVFPADPNIAFPKSPSVVANALYFVGIKQGDVDYTVYRAALTSAGHVGAPDQQRLAGGQAIGASAVVVTADELTMYASYHQPPGSGTDPDDVFVYTRGSATAPWGPATSLALNTTAAEDARWVSPDACRLYFTSDRASGAGGSDLWVASRPK